MVFLQEVLAQSSSNFEWVAKFKVKVVNTMCCCCVCVFVCVCVCVALFLMAQKVFDRLCLRGIWMCSQLCKNFISWVCLRNYFSEIFQSFLCSPLSFTLLDQFWGPWLIFEVTSVSETQNRAVLWRTHFAAEFKFSNLWCMKMVMHMMTFMNLVSI